MANVKALRLLLGLLVFFSAIATAADEPEIVYQKFHRAILGPFHPPGLFPFLSASLREEFDRDTQKSLRFVNKIQFMKDEIPRSYTVKGKTQPAGGSSMRLAVAGEGKDAFGQAIQTNGTVDMVSERGEWKIQLLSWGKRTAP